MPKRAPSRARRPPSVEYQLERLYVDQHPDHVVDAIPAVLAWVPPSAAAAGPFEFQVRGGRPKRPSAPTRLTVGWNVEALRTYDDRVQARAERMRSGSTAQREHVTELAAYGLALVAISAYLPGRRVVGWSRGCVPDILLDATPGALRGVEVAGRSSGGWSALLRVLDGASRESGKIEDLREAANVVEGHVSVWCRSPRVAVVMQVKP